MEIMRRRRPFVIDACEAELRRERDWRLRLAQLKKQERI